LYTDGQTDHATEATVAVASALVARRQLLFLYILGCRKNVKTFVIVDKFLFENANFCPKKPPILEKMNFF